jgi:DNA-directed RNA polymerase subunit RPC12/RpoP
MIRVNQVKELMGITCSDCKMFKLKSEEIAKKIWHKHSVALATPTRQLFDAKKEVENMECNNCKYNIVSKDEPKAVTTKFSYPSTEEVTDAGSETE